MSSLGLPWVLYSQITGVGTELAAELVLVNAFPSDEPDCGARQLHSIPGRRMQVGHPYEMIPVKNDTW